MPSKPTTAMTGRGCYYCRPTPLASWPVYRRSVASLQVEGFTKRTLARLLKRLIDTGFLSKEPGQQGVISTYRLHLPPVRQ